MHSTNPPYKSTTPGRRALREKDVLAQVGFSKSQLWRLIQQGQFPKPARISERCNAWDSLLVDQWLISKFNSGNLSLNKK